MGCRANAPSYRTELRSRSAIHSIERHLCGRTCGARRVRARESHEFAIGESSARRMVLGADGIGERKMTEDLRQSYVDMITKFGVGLDLPKVDVDKLIETQ